MTRFVVIGDPRSGTTWLADMIGQHPQASCLMEPLAAVYADRLDHHHVYWEDDDVWRCGREKPVRGTYAGIGRYFDNKVWTLPGVATGSKLLSFYLSWYPGFRKYIQTVDDLQVIWIERNPLRKALSDWYARQLQNWYASRGDVVKSRESARIPVQFMHNRLREYDDNRKKMDVTFARKPIHRVHYHNLLRHTRGTMNAVCRFLRIEQQEEYLTVFQRMTPQPLEELMLNADEIRKSFPAKWQKHWERDKS